MKYEIFFTSAQYPLKSDFHYILIKEFPGKKKKKKKKKRERMSSKQLFSRR